MAKALSDSFPYMRLYRSVEGWGWHFFASNRPIESRSAAELATRMPARAVLDMMEWGPAKTPEDQLNLMLSRQLNPEQLISLSPAAPALTDDRPVNEYYRLRSRCDRCPFGSDHLRSAVYSELLRFSNTGLRLSP